MAQDDTVTPARIGVAVFSMSRITRTMSLGRDFDLGELFVTEEAEHDLEDTPPYLVFVIPGIRTNGLWVQDAIESRYTVSGREIVIKPVRGNESSGTGRLSTYHLIMRIGLQEFRRSFVSQIETNIDAYPQSPVSIFAHSLGSSLLAEILPDVQKLMEVKGRKIENIVLLGSVCHRSQGKTLRTCCENFINDIGVNDLWPFRASVARPDCYSDVGLWGFLNGYPTLERYFHNNHTTCTSLEHFERNLLPLLGMEEPIPIGLPRGTKGARPRLSENAYVYTRRALWAGALCTVVVPIVLFFTYGFWWAAAGFATLAVMLVTTLFRFGE